MRLPFNDFNAARVTLGFARRRSGTSTKRHGELIDVAPLQKLLRAHINQTRQMYLDVLERRALAETTAERAG
ncbi:MAG: hypothetical protein K8F62_13940 [Pseudorhodoplanes sp.]|nr:hypothetical protein [Pseudorhodoplanes sp.]